MKCPIRNSVVAIYRTHTEADRAVKELQSGESTCTNCRSLVRVPGEVGALGALGAGLYSVGIPKDSVVKYETALKQDQFLLIVHGTDAEVTKARDILESTRPSQLSLHSGEVVATAAV